MNKKVARLLLRPWGSLFEWRWQLGFIENSLSDVVKGKELSVSWATINCKDRWFADPFILDYDEDIISVLAEEKRDKHLGRIALLEFDRKTLCLLNWKILLEKNTHLSFPCIRRVGDHIYVMPENSEANTLELYEYNKFEKKMFAISRLSDEGLVDAIPYECKDGSFLFATKEPAPNGRNLLVYKWDGVKYTFWESLNYSDKHARMAGDFFEVDGTIYRPSQDCNKTYGGAVIIESFNYGKEGFSCSNVRKIESSHPLMKSGLHTFNHYKDLIVIDVKGFKHPRFVRFAQLLKGVLR